MPETASAPDVSAEGANPPPDTATGSSRTGEACARDADASTRPGDSHLEPTPQHRNSDSEPGDELQPLSCLQITQLDPFEAIFTIDELAPFDPVGRSAVERLWNDTGSKELALTLVTETNLYREGKRRGHNACRNVVECAVRANVKRDTELLQRPAADVLAHLFDINDIGNIWDRAETDFARDQFIAAADPALGDRFPWWTWEAVRRVAAADDPRASAEDAVRSLLSNAHTLDTDAVKTILLQEFGDLADVESAWNAHLADRAAEAVEQRFASAFAGALGVSPTAHVHLFQLVRGYLETLRSEPADETAIDGIANWLDKQLGEKHRVAAVDFLNRTINEFAAPDDRAYDDIRLELAAQRRDALTKKITTALGAEAAQTLEKNEYDLDMYLSSTRDLPAVMWGTGKEILWAKGEALLICSDIGCGKTTLAGLLARALLDGGDVLGHPVQSLRDNPRVLYLALDRPAQIGRSLARQITPAMSERYGDRFTFVTGPLPIDLSETPDVFPHIADFYDADIVIVDSLKDIALGISEDRSAANYNRAQQALLASGRELVVLHHLTKKGELYGAKWLDAGVGSVLRITGKPGGPTSVVSQYKPVAHLVSDIRIRHDRDAGEMHVDDDTPTTQPAAGGDLAAWVAEHDNGVTAAELVAYQGGEAGSEAAIVKAKRTLNALAGPDGTLCRVDGNGRGNPTRWLVRT